MIFHFIAFAVNAFLALSWDEQIVTVLGLLWCTLITFYLTYLASINVWKNRHDVSWGVLAILSPLLATMAVLDTLMNLTVFTVLCLDLPRELLVTSRFERYRHQVRLNWRRNLADFICTNLLNPFDPTKHHC